MTLVVSLHAAKVCFKSLLFDSKLGLTSSEIVALAYRLTTSGAVEPPCARINVIRDRTEDCGSCSGSEFAIDSPEISD